MARLAVDPIAPLQGDRAARLDEPTPDQVRGDERRAAPDPALGRRWEIPAFAGMTSWGRGTPNSGLNLMFFTDFSSIMCYLWAKNRILC